MTEATGSLGHLQVHRWRGGSGEGEALGTESCSESGCRPGWGSEQRKHQGRGQEGANAPLSLPHPLLSVGASHWLKTQKLRLGHLRCGPRRGTFPGTKQVTESDSCCGGGHAKGPNKQFTRGCDPRLPPGLGNWAHLLFLYAPLHYLSKSLLYRQNKAISL